jgi:hypothetical protein
MSYNHAFTLAFTVVNDNPDGEATDTELYRGLLRRLENIMECGEMQEACGAPYDTYEEQDPLEGKKYLVDPGPGKWYSLNHSVPLAGYQVSYRISGEELEKYALSGESAVGDHCYNPAVVMRFCDANDIMVQDFVLERLIGRWATDHDNWDYE